MTKVYYFHFIDKETQALRDKVTYLGPQSLWAKRVRVLPKRDWVSQMWFDDCIGTVQMAEASSQNSAPERLGPLLGPARRGAGPGRGVIQQAEEHGTGRAVWVGPRRGPRGPAVSGGACRWKRVRTSPLSLASMGLGMRMPSCGFPEMGRNFRTLCE